MHPRYLLNFFVSSNSVSSEPQSRVLPFIVRNGCWADRMSTRPRNTNQVTLGVQRLIYASQRIRESSTFMSSMFFPCLTLSYFIFFHGNTITFELCLRLMKSSKSLHTAFIDPPSTLEFLRSNNQYSAGILTKLISSLLWLIRIRIHCTERKCFLWSPQNMPCMNLLCLVTISLKLNHNDGNKSDQNH